MRKRGKRLRTAQDKVDKTKRYSIDEALDLLEQVSSAKFDETVELAVRLGVNPKHADQMVRGSVTLPHGTGKEVRVLVFAKGEKEKEALDAGADHAGLDELLAKVKGGWLEFDKVVATPDVMSQVSKLGRVLGPRGLMPNPKTGTVTFDVAQAIALIKAGKVDYRVDKLANIHSLIGKSSFGKEKLRENILALMESVNKAKPNTAKGTYLKNISVSTTMSPGIKIDPGSIMEALR
ncbi:MAG: 50S ribosomal protein L1 [Candidatus Alcyoniella australis]|nr:50S ribosomal protein L1 [Candidatus Alcyoniella australis]